MLDRAEHSPEPEDNTESISQMIQKIWRSKYRLAYPCEIPYMRFPFRRKTKQPFRYYDERPTEEEISLATEEQPNKEIHVLRRRVLRLGWKTLRVVPRQTERNPGDQA